MWASRLELGEALLREFRLRGGKVESLSLASSSVDASTVGVFASKNLRRGQAVLRVESKHWLPLSAQTAWSTMQRSHTDLCNAAVAFARSNPLLQGASSQARLLTVGSVILVSHVLDELDKGTASQAAGQLGAAPKSVDVPMFWSEEELDQLQASPVVGQVQEQRALVSALYDEVVGPNLGLGSATPGNFAFAWALLLSRAIGSVQSNLPFCMPPVLDMFNCHVPVLPALRSQVPQGLCEHFYDETSSTFVITCKNDVDPGQELFIRYGDHNNATLLRKYGFCVAGNLDETLTVPLNMSGGSKKGSVICGYASSGAPIPRLEGNLARHDAKAALQSRLDTYPTALSKDEALLGSLPATEHRLRNALLLRMGEKKLLQDCISVM